MPSRKFHSIIKRSDSCFGSNAIIIILESHDGITTEISLESDDGITTETSLESDDGITTETSLKSDDGVTPF